MAANVALDAGIGAVPLLGDIFDIAWKANIRNVALLERHLAAPPARAQRADRLFVVLLLAGVAIIVAAAVTVAGVVSVWLLRALGLV